MGLVPTRDTGEHGLTRTICLASVPAYRTRLRRILRGDDEHHAAAPILLVLKHQSKHAPALIEDRLVQSRFGCHVMSRRFNRAAGRLGHVGDLQVFNHNGRVVFADLGRKFMQVVMSAIGNLGVNAIDQALLLGTFKGKKPYEVLKSKLTNKPI